MLNVIQHLQRAQHGSIKPLVVFSHFARHRAALYLGLPPFVAGGFDLGLALNQLFKPDVARGKWHGDLHLVQALNRQTAARRDHQAIATARQLLGDDGKRGGGIDIHTAVGCAAAFKHGQMDSAHFQPPLVLVGA